jgi:hypothetical protein
MGWSSPVSAHMPCELLRRSIHMRSNTAGVILLLFIALCDSPTILVQRCGRLVTFTTLLHAHVARESEIPEFHCAVWAAYEQIRRLDISVNNTLPAYIRTDQSDTHERRSCAQCTYMRAFTCIVCTSLAYRCVYLPVYPVQRAQDLGEYV